MRCSTALVLLVLAMAGCGVSRQECRLGQPVRLGGGELTITHSEVRLTGGRAEIGVHFRWTGPVGDLLSGFRGPKLKMVLTDGAGQRHNATRPSWSPILPVPEDTYAFMRNFESYYESKQRDPVLEADAAQYATRLQRLEEDLKQGHGPENWVHVFEAPAGSSGFTLLAENPDRQSGQPQAIAVSLGR